MDYTQYSCQDFVQVLASKSPTPGGGGGAALVGALGVALANMVGSLTVGKKTYQAVEAEVLSLQEACTQLQNRLLGLVEADAACFEPLMVAYRLPAETDAEKQAKSIALEQAGQAACSVPLEIMLCCAEAIPLIARMVEIGSKMAVSDAGCAVSFCRAAMESASLNIYINTRTMKDRAVAEQLNQQAQSLLDTYLPQAERIFTAVREVLR